ncbi:protein tyrosine kinase [Ancylostoma duodenale]|uniref:receptor protein-tyrosine kinase n=1 Tax=Ancylostoma duodenale TaxID=51022 RepID=A0A0C2DBS1_9BILA|nr:protein tyrosine kinase [Ancylostoma duodenale]
MLPKYASDSARAEFMHEIELDKIRSLLITVTPYLQRMKTLGCHDNIVCMLGCITAANKSCLVIEYCASRDLLRKTVKCPDVTSLLQSRSMDKQIECTKEFLNFAWQIAKGMSFLGQKNIIHRDLAARNILISDTDGMKSAKISDFGLSLSTEDSSQLPARGRLPIKWLALECLQREIFSIKSDVWSYGIVLFEMYSMGERPFEDIEPLNLIAHLEAGNRPKRPLAEVMTRCWDKVPDKRPTFEELLVIFATLLEQSTEGYGYLALIKTAETYMALTELSPLSRKEVAECSNSHFYRSGPEQDDDDYDRIARKRATTFTTPASSIDSAADMPDSEVDDADNSE